MKECYVRWSHLPHAPFRLLCYMAVVSKDDDPRFYGGREACAMALGMSPDADEKARQAMFRQVRRHIDALCQAQVIERTFAGAPGRNAEYTLRLSMERRTLNDPQTADAERPPSTGQRGSFSVRNGGRSTAERGSFSGTTGVGERPPEDIQEPQDLRPGRSTHPHRSVPRARAHARVRDNQQPLWPHAVDDSRCQQCRADHTGLTCEQYRNGDDLRGAS